MNDMPQTIQRLSTLVDQFAVTEAELLARFREFYSGFPLVEVRGGIPEVKQVRGSHRLILGGFAVSEANPARVSIVAVLDNLLKGRPRRLFRI